MKKRRGRIKHSRGVFLIHANILVCVFLLLINAVFIITSFLYVCNDTQETIKDQLLRIRESVEDYYKNAGNDLLFFVQGMNLPETIQEYRTSLNQSAKNDCQKDIMSSLSFFSAYTELMQNPLIIIDQQAFGKDYRMTYGNKPNGVSEKDAALQIYKSLLNEDFIENEFGEIIISEFTSGAFICAQIPYKKLFSEENIENVCVLNDKKDILYENMNGKLTQDEQTSDKLISRICDGEFGFDTLEDTVIRHLVRTADGTVYEAGSLFFSNYIIFNMISLEGLIHRLFRNAILACIVSVFLVLFLMRPFFRAAIHRAFLPLEWIGKSIEDEKSFTGLLQKLEHKSQMKTRIFLCCCVIFVPLVLSVAFNNVINQPVILESVVQKYEQRTENHANTISGWITQKIRYCHQINSDRNLRELIEKIVSDSSKETEQALLERMLKLGIFSQVQEVAVYSKEGEVKFSTSYDEKSRGLSSEVLGYYQNARTYKFCSIWMDDYDTENVKIVFPVRQINSSRSQPLFSIRGFVELYFDDLPTAYLQMNEYSYIYSKHQWRLVGTPLEQKYRSMIEGYSQSRQNESTILSEQIYLDYKNVEKTYRSLRSGTPWMMNSVEIVPGNWVYSEIRPMQLILERTRSFYYYIIGLCVILLFMLWPLSSMLARKVIRPVQNMKKEIIDAEINEDAVIDPKNEFVAITYAFIKQLQAMKKLHEEALNAQRECLLQEKRKAEAENIMLLSQMDSHLFSNLFASMQLLLRIGDLQMLQKMLEASARYLRNGLIMKFEDVTVSSEIDHAKSYVELQTLRYEDAFEVEFEVDQDALEGIKMPQYILQPLIENAIRHGMCTEKVLHVWIFIKLKNDYLEISVINDGKPLSDEDTDKVTRILDERTTNMKHIGLSNVQERLRIRYGLNWGLAITNEEEKVCVRIYLPCDKDRKERKMDV